MTIDLSDTFQPHPALASEVVDHELVVLQLEDGVYYGLDALGTHAWRQLSEGKPLEELVREFARRFPGQSREQLLADLQTLTEELVRCRLLIPRAQT